MSTACVIPARFLSSRFPGKLLKRVNGKTVLQYTIESAQSCPMIDQLFVATDDERIASHVSELGVSVIWTSPHCPSGTDRIAEALDKSPELQKAHFILNLQGDHPLTKPETISETIQALKKNTDTWISTAVTPIQTMEQFLSPHVVKCVFDQSFRALYFSRSPIPYHSKNTLLQAYAHIGIYCYCTEFLKNFLRQKPSFLQKCEDLEQLKVLENGDPIRIAVVEEEILGIDTPKDLEKLKEFLCPLNISS